MVINTAAILCDKWGNQYKHGWTKDDLDALKELGLFKYMDIHLKGGIISRVFLYDVDRSVDYDYINWTLAGGEYASLAEYTDDDHDMEEKLLVLRNKLELDADAGSGSLDTFRELFSEQLIMYQRYLDLVKSCKLLLLEDIRRLLEEREDICPS